MNIKQEVFSKITELAKEQEVHKVEFGMIQDVISLLKQGQDMNTSASSMLDSAKVKFNDSLKPLQSAKKLMDKVYADSKSLGLEIPRETLAIFDRVDSFIASSTDSISKLNQIK